MIENFQWPPDYAKKLQDRQKRLILFRTNPEQLRGAKLFYTASFEGCIQFIEDWMDTVDPRNAGKPGKMVRMPFVLFPKQRELVKFLFECVHGETSGLIEKSRDMGATWVCAAFSVWLLLFRPGAAIGWGSRQQILVDRLGVMDSIFEKMRAILQEVPKELLPPDVELHYMRILCPSLGTSIVGESGDDIGRGGRTLIYFKDESAHYERPENIEAALADNTNVQIDISSVRGTGNVFHRRREGGVEWHSSTGVTHGRTNIFVMDWRDHPDKDEKWYNARRRKAEDDGLLHIFAQEVDRNYSASVEGTILPAAWVRAAIDAHEKLANTQDIALDDGGYMCGLDVADEGMDKNAFAKRRGVHLLNVEDWGERDTGVTARKAVGLAVTPFAKKGAVKVQYDSIGVGAGIKAETNRLKEELDGNGSPLMPRGIKFISWNAGAKVQKPDERVVSHDRESPLNKDFFENMKAQAWFSLRARFEKTYRAVTDGVRYDPSELISISSKIPKLRQLEKELSQPTSTKSSRLKYMVKKAPKNTKSPNLADAVVMCFFPAESEGFTDYNWI